MHLIAYFPSLDQANHPFHVLADHEALAESALFYNDLASFSQCLSAPCREGTVVLLVLDTSPQLDEILSLRDLLGDLPVAVVLPCHDPSLVGRAHLLRPRFLTYLDQEPEVLLLVLSNIAKKHWPGLDTHPTQARQRPRGAGARR